MNEQELQRLAQTDLGDSEVGCVLGGLLRASSAWPAENPEHMGSFVSCCRSWALVARF